MHFKLRGAEVATSITSIFSAYDNNPSAYSSPWLINLNKCLCLIKT